MYKYSLIMIMLIFMMSSCGGNDTVRPDSDQTQTGPVNPYGDPPDYSGDPFADFPDVTGVSIPSGQDQQDVGEEEVLSGTHFTVQISAATSESDARSLAESVDAQTTLPVFVDQEGGYWKVRVGAFPARQDAVDFIQTMVNMGFPDAWVTTR